MHDVLDLRDIVLDEWRQLDSDGHDVGALEDAVRAAVAADDVKALRALRVELAAAPRVAGWRYQEPATAADAWAALEAPHPGRPWTAGREDLADRVYGAWLARCVACAMGKPVEGLSRSQVERYLRAAGAWPQTGYVPLVEPLPAGVEALHWSAPFSLAGHFDAAPPDDDTDYTLLGLHLVERYGRELTAADVAREWLDRLPFTQTYTAERATYRNLVAGDPPQIAGLRDNPYREWIGALIRVDAYGYVFPGAPEGAARLAAADASLSHQANGIYGATWAAALIAAAFTAADVREALDVAATWVPPRTRLREALDQVAAMHDDGRSWPDAVVALDELVGHYDWVHTINNAAGIAAALLWGGGDLVRSAAAVIALGWDSDSSAATVGSVLGAMYGASIVPPALADPLNDTLRSALRDYDRSSISDLADRTLTLALRHLDPAEAAA